jgi:hypothetical protein
MLWAKMKGLKGHRSPLETMCCEIHFADNKRKEVGATATGATRLHGYFIQIQMGPRKIQRDHSVARDE